MKPAFFVHCILYLGTYLHMKKFVKFPVSVHRVIPRVVPELVFKTDKNIYSNVIDFENYVFQLVDFLLFFLLFVVHHKF
jgi:hypothetical protein